MRYLITGGSGFIGSHLTESLLEHGHDVHVIDNFSTVHNRAPVFAPAGANVNSHRDLGFIELRVGLLNS